MNMLKRTRIFELDLINDSNFDATIASMINFQQEYQPDGDKLPLLFTPNVDDVVKLSYPGCKVGLGSILSAGFVNAGHCVD